jgi:hypothetical protein
LFDIRDLNIACIWLAPSLGFQEPETIESLLAASLSDVYRAYWRYMVALPPRLGGFPALDRWIRQHANIRNLGVYYSSRVDSHAAFFDPLASSYAADPLSKANGRGVIHMSHWNAQKLRQEHDAFLKDHPSAEAHLLRLDRLRKPAPLYKSWTVADQILGCRSIEAQRAGAERFQYLASHQKPDFYKRTRQRLKAAPGHPSYFETMTDPESTRTKLTAGRALLARLQNQPEADRDFISKYEPFLGKLAERLEVLEKGRESDAPDIPIIPAAYWQPTDFLPDGASYVSPYNANDVENLTYYDNAWWFFALIKRSGYRICAFRIDDHTLETEIKTFPAPKNSRLNNADIDFSVLSGGKIVIGTDTEHGTLVLDWPSGEMAVVSGFKTCYFREGGSAVEVIVSGGKVYYTAVPDYVRNKYKAKRNSLVFLQLNPATLEQKVIFNFRRNPPETPLDKPIVSKYSNKGFIMRFSKPEGLFGFVHSHDRYAFDPATSEFTEISRGDFRKINRTAKRVVNRWPTRDGASDWYILRKDGYEDLELGDAVPLALVERKNDNAVAVVGLEFQKAPGGKVPPSESFKAAIRARERYLRLYGYSKEHALLEAPGQGIAFIKYEDMEPALEKE